VNPEPGLAPWVVALVVATVIVLVVMIALQD